MLPSSVCNFLKLFNSPAICLGSAYTGTFFETSIPFFTTPAGISIISSFDIPLTNSKTSSGTVPEGKNARLPLGRYTPMLGSSLSIFFAFILVPYLSKVSLINFCVSVALALTTCLEPTNLAISVSGFSPASIASCRVSNFFCLP